jgi:hypothetical protein
VSEDWNAMLERQVAYFSSDQLLIDRAEPWRGVSPEECLVATMESCREVECMFAMMAPEVRERAMQPEPIPEDILLILQAIRR